ncbi:AEC family transporter [Candidatus Omnitrophota bacterium]
MFFTLMITTFHGMIEVLVIGIAGALIIGGLKSSHNYMPVLSSLFIRITLPCLIFSNMVTHFHPEEVLTWWVFPLIGITLFLAGGLLAFGYIHIDRSVKYRGIFTSSVAFHNSILLPLAFAPVLFGPGRLEMFLNLLFLYNILAIPAFFTVGVWLINSSAGERIRIVDFFTPPNSATILGLLFVFSGWNVYIPMWVLRPLTTFGSLATPLSILIVGGIIVSSLPKTKVTDWKDPIKITMLKSIVLPAFACLFVYLVRPTEYIALFIIMGSVMPVSTVIAIVCPSQEEIQKIVAGGILLSSLASILAVPLFMGVYGKLYGWK